NTTFCAEDATNSKGTTVETARTEWCTAAGDNDDNIFDVQCGALDRSGTAIAGTLDARLAACQNSLVSLGPKAPVNACVAESTMICGTATAPGSAPFSAICALVSRNPATGADIVPTQQAFCRLDETNNGLEICTDTIAAFCGPKDAPKATETAVFDGLCLGAEYLTAQRTYCSVTADFEDTNCDTTTQEGASASITVTLCDGREVGDTPHATVCGTDNVAAQETFCGLTHDTDPTACAATRTVACANTVGNNPFNEALCFETGNTFDAQRTARADDCRDGTLDKDNPAICPVAVNTCNGAPFGVDGAACDATVYANALIAFCTVGENIFDTRCETQSIAGTADARLARCAGPIADLGSSAASDNTTCLTESVAICGTETAPGTNAYAEICDDAARNANHGTLVAVRAAYCLANDRRPGCADDTDNNNAVTSGDFARGQAAPLNVDPTAENQFLE
ncbi:MAG: hypothetical protein K8953_01275, partial [Proteobacteria bacterium]|nr:hypothetical protein [Pseudomonadota bacterium]